MRSPGRSLAVIRDKLWDVLKSIYRLIRAESVYSVDNHIEDYIISDFVDVDYGAMYGVNRKNRAELLKQIETVARNIPTATQMLYHVILAREILKIPPSIEGSVIECGVYKGASSASLSLACDLVGRKLLVCDSFQGLPESESEITRNYPHSKVYGYYQQGMYSGSLGEVQANIREYGKIDCCEFVPGLFSQSLSAISSKLVFAFLDVDLTSSMKDCIKHVWPKLVDGGLVYTDDSCDMEVVRVWFDDHWWQQELGERAPGYVGSGCGLPTSVNISSLGYVRKIASVQQTYGKVSWLAYPRL